MAAFKVIVIDPIKREVRAERLLEGLKPLYATMKTDIVQVIYPDAIGGETMYVDEEGKQKPNHHFELRTFDHDVLAGVCVIAGDECDTQWSPEEIEEFVTWRPDLDGEQLLV
jgi:hypothetical protein